MDINKFTELSVDLEAKHREAADQVLKLRRAVVLLHMMGLSMDTKARVEVSNDYRRSFVSLIAKDGTVLGKIKRIDIPKEYQLRL